MIPIPVNHAVTLDENPPKKRGRPLKIVPENSVASIPEVPDTQNTSS